MIRPEKCDTCGAWVYMEDDGWLIPHTVQNKFGNDPCEGRKPRKPDPKDYTVGYDSDPWVMNGGLPTLGRDR